MSLVRSPCSTSTPTWEPRLDARHWCSFPRPDSYQSFMYRRWWHTRRLGSYPNLAPRAQNTSGWQPAGARTSALSAAGVALPGAAAAEAALPAGAALPADFSLLSACGCWRVRPLDKGNMDELRRVVSIQAQAFYESSPIPLLDGLFQDFFAAEVLSEMQKKVRFNPSERFVLLVVEQVSPDGAGAGGSGSRSSVVGSTFPHMESGSGSNDSSCGGDSSTVAAGSSDIIGVVEVSYLNEKEVLRSLPPDTAAFAYIASMAVEPAWQQRGVAKALLQAAELVAGVWEELQPVLHVYQDNLPAVKLYESRGYSVIHQDSPLWGRVGARPRYLMQKQLDQAGDS